jgi:hypothetical protein
VGEGVENVALCLGVKERLRLVLSMQIYQEGTELPKHSGGRRTAIHPGPRTTLRRYLPAHDHAAILDIETEIFNAASGPCFDAFEGSFDDRLRGTRPDASTGRPFAQKKGKRIDQHRLPCTGLAGEHIETWTELESDVGDGGEISYAEFSKHL